MLVIVVGGSISKIALGILEVEEKSRCSIQLIDYVYFAYTVEPDLRFHYRRAFVISWFLNLFMGYGCKKALSIPQIRIH